MARRYLLSHERNSFASVYISLYPPPCFKLTGDDGCDLVLHSLSNASLSKKDGDDGDEDPPALAAAGATPAVAEAARGRGDDAAEELLCAPPPRKPSRELAAATTKELGREECIACKGYVVDCMGASTACPWSTR